jgi:hypothetical protein
MEHLQTAAVTALDRAIDRRPVFLALTTLGLSYAELGRLMGVSGVMVHHWAVGRKPLSRVRFIGLEYLAAELSGMLGARQPQNTRFTRRGHAAIEAARRWTELAKQELHEETGGVFTAKELERGFALGRRMLARLEAQ